MGGCSEPTRAGRAAGAQGKRLLLQKHGRATLSRHEHFIVLLLNLAVYLFAFSAWVSRSGCDDLTYFCSGTAGLGCG